MDKADENLSRQSDLHFAQAALEAYTERELPKLKEEVNKQSLYLSVFLFVLILASWTTVATI